MEGVVQPRRAHRAARPRLDVDHRHRGLVPGDPARLGEAIAEVEILHVHPVALVEQPHLVERRSADQHEGAVDRVDRPRFDFGRAIGGQGPPVALAPQPGEVPKRAQRSGERALGGVVEGPVLELQPAAGDPDLDALLHQVQQPIQGARRHPGVGVEAEHIGGAACPDCDVARGAEAEVLRRHGQAHLGEIAADHLRRVVPRGVVDHAHGHSAAWGMVAKRAEAVPQQPLAAVGDDYDVK